MFELQIFSHILQNTILHVNGLRESIKEVSSTESREESLVGEHNERQMDEHWL